MDSQHFQTSADADVLQTIGYKQELRRDFGILSSLGVSLGIIAAVPGIALSLYYNLGYVGTAGLVWGWIMASFVVICVGLSMAELSSSMPTAGGMYYCSAALAPDGWAPLISYLVGWSNWLGLCLSGSSGVYATVLLIFSLRQMYDPSFEVTNAKLFGVSVGFNLFMAFFISLPGKYLSKHYMFITIAQTIFTVIFLIVLLAGDQRPGPNFNSNSFVWGTITNSTEWSDGWAMVMSMLAGLYTMGGYDAPFHMSEECVNTRINTPRAIMWSAILSSAIGWACCVIIAYTVSDFLVIFESTAPFIAYVGQVVSFNWTVAIGVIVTFFTLQSCQGVMLTSSRLTYAYARDGAFPFSNWLSQVNKRTGTPVNAIIANFLVQFCSLFLAFGGTVVIYALFANTAVALYFAYAVPIALRALVPSKFIVGPWNLGRMSRAFHAFTALLVFFCIPVLLFPSVKGKDLTPELMNWGCLTWGGVLLLAGGWYAIRARHTFKGPIISHLGEVGLGAHDEESQEKDWATTNVKEVKE